MRRRHLALGLAVCLVLGAALWRRPSRRELRYLGSILRQVPDMPGRYAV